MNIKELILHSIGAALVAFTAIGCAVALDCAQHYLQAHGTSEWLTTGIEGLSMFLFVTDAILLCLVVSITSVRLVFDLLQPRQP